MGKYLPVIVTADCGSLTRAGEVLGYAQPNMGHIITRCEEASRSSPGTSAA